MARNFSVHFDWGLRQRNKEQSPAIPSPTALQNIAADQSLSLLAFTLIEHVDERAHDGSGGHDTESAARIVTDLAFGQNQETQIVAVGKQNYNGKRMLCTVVEFEGRHYFVSINSKSRNEGTVFEVENYTTSREIARERRIDLLTGKDAQKVIGEIRKKLLN